MADLAAVVRAAVETARQVTDSLQCVVQHRSWDGTNDPFGKPNLGGAVERKALVDRKQRVIRTATAQEAMSQAYVAFLQPVVITQHDEIVLPDGTTGPILNYTGFMDAGTDQPYFAEVYLG